MISVRISPGASHGLSRTFEEMYQIHFALSCGAADVDAGIQSDEWNCAVSRRNCIDQIAADCGHVTDLQ